MCGIAGFVEARATRSRDELEAIAERMAGAIAHRGPDDAGTWADASTGVALANRRLAVIDLSPAGHMPMTSHDGRVHVTFNGEVYDHEELRSTLRDEGVRFRGRSDTEVLLECICRWGMRRALERSVGMYAFATWDEGRRTLTLVRDRMGEKPLYYGFQGGAFLFGSELKALRAHPSWQGRVDRSVVASYMRHGYVPGPWSVFEGIRQLPPGCTLTVSHAALAAGALPEPEPYWSMLGAARAGIARPFEGDEREAADEVERALDAAVRGQMVADVPLGAFLSGGIDSSTVVALMARAGGPVRTFTMGFAESGHDESAHARAVAAHLGTRHEELLVTPAEAMAVLPDVVRAWDEPFADPSQVPTLLVARLARRHVTVSLSGDGGDELFAGYNRHVWTRNAWRILGALPPPLRRLASDLVRSVPASAWSSVLRALGPLVPQVARRPGAGDRVHQLASLGRAADPVDFYRRLVSLWDEPEMLVRGAREAPTRLSAPMAGEPRWRDFVERIVYLDSVTYLPDDILVKVDRAAMSVSLETRVPLLDHRVVELAWRLPASMRLRGSTGKRVLRRVLARHVPPSLFERPKAGFGLPIDTWLRGGLRDWAESLLAEDRLEREGWLEPSIVRRAWESHLAGSPQHYRLWAVLMWQAWLEEWGS